jgi:hypothetical protein
LKKTPEFQARFPTYLKLEQEGRAVTVDFILGYERTIRQQLSVLGPEAQKRFSTPDRIGEMIYGSVSPEESQTRIDMASYASTTAPPSVQKALVARYGLTAGDMASFWLEPDETTAMLQTRMGAARLVGAANEYGFDKEMGTGFAEDLARQGYDYNAARQNLAEAQQRIGLEGEQGVQGSDLVESQFGRVEAARRVNRATQARKSRFSDQGGADSGKEGISGLGSSANV